MKKNLTLLFSLIPYVILGGIWVNSSLVQSSDIQDSPNRKAINSVVERSFVNPPRTENQHALQLQKQIAELHTLIVNHTSKIEEMMLASGNPHAKEEVQNEESESHLNTKVPFTDQIRRSLTDTTINEDITDRTYVDVTKQLDNVPGTVLLSLACDEQACQADFLNIDGTRPDTSNLWGIPPFVNEGITEHNDDGTVSIFFTQAGVSLDDYQNR